MDTNCELIISFKNKKGNSYKNKVKINTIACLLEKIFNHCINHHHDIIANINLFPFVFG